MSASIVQDAIFWVSISTIAVGLIKYSIKYATRFCKISSVSCCWGCFSQQRDIKSEIEIEKARIDAHVNEDDSGEFPASVSETKVNDTSRAERPQRVGFPQSPLRAPRVVTEGFPGGDH